MKHHKLIPFACDSWSKSLWVPAWINAESALSWCNFFFPKWVYTSITMWTPFLSYCASILSCLDISLAHTLSGISASRLGFPLRACLFCLKTSYPSMPVIYTVHSWWLACSFQSASITACALQKSMLAWRQPKFVMHELPPTQRKNLQGLLTPISWYLACKLRTVTLSSNVRSL